MSNAIEHRVDLSVCKNGEKILKRAIVKYINGLKGYRKNYISHGGLQKYFANQKKAFLEAVIQDLVRANKILVVSQTVRPTKNTSLFWTTLQLESHFGGQRAKEKQALDETNIPDLVVKYCEECGSTNIFWEGAVGWDVQKQAHSLDTIHDLMTCNDCCTEYCVKDAILTVLGHITIDSHIFDNFEVHPVIAWDENNILVNIWEKPDLQCSYEPLTSDEEVEKHKDFVFWSVYGHLMTGGLECLHDFKTDKEANLVRENYMALLSIEISPEAE